jgi:hypothetical protein
VSRVEGYDYRLLLLRTMQAWPKTGCWVCEKLLPALVAPSLIPHDVERCRVNSLATPDAHHMIPKQALKAYAPAGLVRVVTMGMGAVLQGPEWQVFDARMAYIVGDESARVSLGDLLMDVRNTVPVRRFHHDALERRLLHGRPFEVPRRLLPPAVVEFAGEYGLGRLLEAEYGDEGEGAGA